MPNDMTIVYYSSNREKDAFAEEIRKQLLVSAKGLPIISVTQKPLDFGTNICVGDVGISNANVFRQIQVGCKAAKTPFVAMAETDCLYPEEHFEFRPHELDSVYRNIHLWILYLKHKKYRRKEFSLCNQIAGREFLIKAVDECLEGKPMWNNVIERSYLHGDQRVPHIFKKRTWNNFTTKIACINVCHDTGMHGSTGTFGKMHKELPHWGNSKKMLKKLHLI